MVDVENIKHIAENQRLIGDVVEKTAADWKSQKETLYRETGFNPLTLAVPPQQEEDRYSPQRNSKKRKEACDDPAVDEGNENMEDPEDFCRELEETLLLEPLECDDEEAEPTEEDT